MLDSVDTVEKTMHHNMNNSGISEVAPRFPGKSGPTIMITYTKARGDKVFATRLLPLEDGVESFREPVGWVGLSPVCFVHNLMRAVVVP